MVVHISRKPSNIYIYLQVVYFLSIVHLQIFLLTSNSLCYCCFSEVQEGKDDFSGTARSSLPQLEEDVWALERPRRWSCWGWEKPQLGHQDAKEETKPAGPVCGLRKRTVPDAQIAKSSPFLSGDMHNERKFETPFERYNSNLTNYRGSLIYPL
jgi:hypothetical protein